MVTKADSPEESLKVMDFGFAGFAAKPHLQLAELTGHGPIYAIGTPGYVSPEMIRGDRVDCRSDLYSVGIILYEMLTGRLPFAYDTEQELLVAHVKEPPPHFYKIDCFDIPAGVESVVQLAIGKYPNERPQSARELAEQYGQCFGENYWESSAPADWTPVPRSDVMKVIDPTSKPTEDPFRLTHRFNVMIPERLAAAKLRGFADDIDGRFMASDPGVVRMRIGVPDGFDENIRVRSGLLGWLTGMRHPSVPRGQEPIELTLHMQKPDPSQTLLNVVAEFTPLKEYRPHEADCWRIRCDKLNAMLRQYLGA
jgi:serine/threonine protein kinase